MSNLIKALKEARELKRRLDNAQACMCHFDGFKKEISESEVEFRYSSVVGVLRMAQNDVNRMIEVWEELLK